MVVGIALFVLGLAGVAWGAMFLFNVRGAADKAAARRNAVRAVTAARTMDLGLAEPSQLGAWFFRLMGGIVLLGSPLLALAGLVIATLD
ncbi:hypothetical protein [Streptomyces galbus]|uniref:Type II secretion system F family protein n=1 Tax=Streptomyces galbus TaxID=33898 RepID=A0A4U5WUZ4_STRGB|nr:hypothetical protein [Streptomyces galbus]TKT06050.1 hypothetical protein E4U92_30020 [Streptomyces galbus]GHD38358.1 hypothetical protein GCM10010335_36940 [Streptomyces galbus]